MKSLISFLLCFFFLVISCHKEDKDIYPVIYPGTYFPVYPNSWWKYMDQDSNITSHSVHPAFQLNNYITGMIDFDKPTYSDPFYVPFYDGTPIYYYDKIGPGGGYPFDGSFKRWPILSEQIGFTFQKEWVDPRLSQPVEMVVVKGKYFNGIDSILVQESHWTMNVNDAITTQEWAKNIGLILQFCRDTITGDTLSKTWLVDYYVSFDSTSVDYQ
jgi:hypothetical protein